MFGIDFDDTMFDDPMTFDDPDGAGTFMDEPYEGYEGYEGYIQSPHHDFDINTQSIPFTGHIDDLYDPEINSHAEKYLHELEVAAKSDNANDISRHIQQAKSELHSVEYWENCKTEAKLDAEKSAAFIDGINEQWEIADRYSKEIEDIFKKGENT